MSDEGAWVLLKLDAKEARRRGMPEQVPVQKGEFDAMADKGLTAELARKSITAFMQQAPSSWRTENHGLATRYEAYLGKGTFLDRAEKAMAAGDLPKVISALGMVSRLDKDDHACRLNLALAHAQAGDQASAKKELDGIVET